MNQQEASKTIVEVALSTPLRRRFDYLIPTSDVNSVQIGERVRVSFGRQQLIGVVLAAKEHSQYPIEKLKPYTERLDQQPLLCSHLLELCLWASRYYQAPVGEAVLTALPTALRQGETATVANQIQWSLTPEGQGLPQGGLKRAPKQAQLLDLLRTAPQTSQALKQATITSATIKALESKGLITGREQPIRLPQQADTPETPLTLNNEQDQALKQIQTDGFNCYLLEGATGSGKTEVYLQAIAKVLAACKQVLILVPEIGLTPQTLNRFSKRFREPIVSLHSGLNDTERKHGWLYARSGEARIVIGTRSAIFTPMPDLGMIIIDEEHDPSLKQQDGFRYSARDLACLRAQKLDIPLILGSATPAFESLLNAEQGRFQKLVLTQRAGNAKPPQLETLDIRSTQLEAGLCHSAKQAIRATLDRGEQALVFINRRGFAPALCCHDCGWQAHCPNCSAKLTLHQRPRHLHCHHCDYQRPTSYQCPECLSTKVVAEGVGTERSEEELEQLFPDADILRIDRDSTRRKNAFKDMLARINTGKPCILVGTQMLAKGHHFANVTLVIIADADSGFFSGDFRGPERTGQLLLQVAGRAGRAEKPGRVIIQSRHCDHPFIQTLLTQGYSAFAQLLLKERHLGHLPPYRHLALIKAEAKHPDQAFELLQQARVQLEHWLPASEQLQYLGPLPALMERKQDRFRYQLQVNTASRSTLQPLLANLAYYLEALPAARAVRWSIDVDPIDMS